MNYLNYHTGRPRFHFEGEPSPPTPPAPPTSPSPPPAAWHSGVDPEFIGHAQNKGWKLDDPKEAFSAAAKVARDLERHFGAPVDRIHKMPKADAKPEDFAAFWQGLGAPKDPKEYDFSGIKFAGQDLEADFAEAMRTSLAAAFVPKDKATSIVQSVVKFLESADTSETTVNAAKLAEEKQKLNLNWGPKYDFNHLQAMEGARRSGITPEAVKAMENQIGYANVMEHFRKIGANTSEDTFIDRGSAGGTVATREGAMARKSELMNDPGWAKKFTAGDAEARREYDRLNLLIEGA
jgi:hypothetical protein